MKIIKFRVWDKKEKQMNFTDKQMLRQGRAVQFNFMIPWRENIFSDEWELMQFTGLKDINGVEIYEGDIVLHHDHPQPLPRVAIEWNDKTARFEPRIGLMSEAGEWLEVIGNVYENPELLKGTE